MRAGTRRGAFTDELCFERVLTAKSTDVFSLEL